MKNLTILLALTLSACGSDLTLPIDATESSGTETSSNSDDLGGSLDAVADGSVDEAETPSYRVTIKSGSTVVAYVLGIGQDQVNIYVPSVERYVAVAPSDGSYTAWGVFYASTGCTGAAASSYSGILGKAVVYGNSKYYLVNSSVTNFAYASMWSNGTCTNTSSTYSGKLGSLTEVSRPYDFSSMAPLSLTYE